MKQTTIEALAVTLGLSTPCVSAYTVMVGNWGQIGEAFYETSKRTRRGAWLARRFAAKYTATGLMTAPTVSLKAI